MVPTEEEMARYKKVYDSAAKVEGIVVVKALCMNCCEMVLVVEVEAVARLMVKLGQLHG